MRYKAIEEFRNALMEKLVSNHIKMDARHFYRLVDIVWGMMMSQRGVGESAKEENGDKTTQRMPGVPKT